MPLYVVGSSARETYTMYRETCTSKSLFHEILAVRSLPFNVITVKFVMFGELGVQTTVIVIRKIKRANSKNLEN